MSTNRRSNFLRNCEIPSNMAKTVATHHNDSNCTTVALTGKLINLCMRATAKIEKNYSLTSMLVRAFLTGARDMASLLITEA